MTIYFVEIPHQGPVRCWSAASKEKAMAVIDSANPRRDSEVFESTTGAELAEMLGYDAPAELKDEYPEIAAVIEKHGMEMTLYRRWDDEQYSTEPSDEWQAYVDYNGRDLSSQRVYMTREKAVNAVENDGEWVCHGGIQAQIELRKELSK